MLRTESVEDHAVVWDRRSVWLGAMASVHIDSVVVWVPVINRP